MFAHFQKKKKECAFLLLSLLKYESANLRLCKGAFRKFFVMSL